MASAAKVDPLTADSVTGLLVHSMRRRVGFAPCRRPLLETNTDPGFYGLFMFSLGVVTAELLLTESGVLC